MKCAKCQFDNREGVKFCEKCGAKMEVICPNCGAKEMVPTEDQQLLCVFCGTSFGQVTRICPKCGHRNEDGAHHCARCGTQILVSLTAPPSRKASAVSNVSEVVDS